MGRNIDYAVVNITAHPHPKGTYRKLFDAAAQKSGIKFWGSQSTGISPVAERDGLLVGRVAFWTDIDPKSPVIRTSSKEQVSQRDASVGLPRGIGFNPRVFNFAFNENSHTVYVELENDERQRTSAGMIERAFAAIFSEELVGGVEVDVQLKAGKDALRSIFSMDHIRRVEIDIRLPNPDDLSKEEEEILRELEALNARRLNVEIYRNPGDDTIELTPRYLAMANLAQNNGFVVAEGKTEEGDKDVRSTKKHPAVISRAFGGAGDDSSYGTLVALAAE